MRPDTAIAAALAYLPDVRYTGRAVVNWNRAGFGKPAVVGTGAGRP